MHTDTVLAILAVACAVVLADKGKHEEKIKKFVAECKTELKATDADVANLKDCNATVTHAGKCVMNCVGKKMHAGKKDKAAAKKEKRDTKEAKGGKGAEMRKKIATCKALTDADECEKAFKIRNCMHCSKKA